MGDDYDTPDLGDDDGLLQPVKVPGVEGLSFKTYLPLPGLDLDPPSPYPGAPWPGPSSNDPGPAKWWQQPQLDGPPPQLIKPGQPPTETPQLPDPNAPVYGPPKPPPSSTPLPNVPDLDYTLPMPGHPQPPTGHEPPTVTTDPTIPRLMPFWPGGD